MTVPFVPSFSEGISYLLQSRTGSTPLDSYKTNYYKAQAQSIAIGASSYILAGITACLSWAKASKQAVLCTAISSLFMGVFWHYVGNKPVLLAERVKNLVWRSNLTNEQKDAIALACIQEGAELVPSKKEHDFLFFPLFPVSLASGDNYQIDLLSRVAAGNYNKALDFLLSLNISNFDYSNALYYAVSIKTAQALLKSPGYSTENKEGRDSPLSDKIASFSYSPNILDKPNYTSEADHLAQLTEKLNIIKLFLETGLNVGSTSLTDKFTTTLNSLKSIQSTLTPLIEEVKKLLKTKLSTK